MKDTRTTDAAIKARRAKVAKLYPHMSNADVAKKVGASETTIVSDVKAMGIKKSPEYLKAINNRISEGRYRWEPLRGIMELVYPVMAADQLSELFGMPPSIIRHQANIWGLKKQKDARARSMVRNNRARKGLPMDGAQNGPEFSAIGKSGPKMPPPMTPAMLARMERERFSYPDGALPFRARPMFGPLLTGYDLSYRGQA